MILALVRAWLRTMPTSKERRRAVRYVAELLAMEIGDGNVVRLRPPAHDGAVMDAKLKAEAYWEAARALFAPLLVED